MPRKAPRNGLPPVRAAWRGLPSGSSLKSPTGIDGVEVNESNAFHVKESLFFSGYSLCVQWHIVIQLAGSRTAMPDNPASSFSWDPARPPNQLSRQQISRNQASPWPRYSFAWLPWRGPERSRWPGPWWESSVWMPGKGTCTRGFQGLAGEDGAGTPLIP